MKNKENDNEFYNDNYIESFKEWLVEMEMRMDELEYTIKNCEKIKDSNKKQLKLLEKRCNFAIAKHNEWAEKNNYPKLG